MHFLRLIVASFVGNWKVLYSTHPLVPSSTTVDLYSNGTFIVNRKFVGKYHIDPPHLHLKIGIIPISLKLAEPKDTVMIIRKGSNEIHLSHSISDP